MKKRQTPPEAPPLPTPGSAEGDLRTVEASLRQQGAREFDPEAAARHSTQNE